MTIFSGIIVFLLIFWTLLFMILPWGNRAGDIPEEGMAGSAPANPRIKQKFLITLGISTILWIIIFTLIQMEVVDFYEISREMVREDHANNQ